MLDTNLMVLFVVGATHPALIARHKNVSRFRAADYLRLVSLLRLSAQIVVTPNIATETSNLVRQIAAPYDIQLSDTLSRLLNRFIETIVSSASAAADVDHGTLGLADAATLRALKQGWHLLTVDAGLHRIASRRGLAASHFDHAQPQTT